MGKHKGDPIVFDSLTIVDEDSDNGMSFEERFCDAGSLDEGICGRKGIDTTFENTSEMLVENPRSMYETSAKDDTPEPMDLDRYPHRRY